MRKKLTNKVNRVNEMKQVEYAEYRGVSKPMVSKWKADGRLVMNGKLILVNESDARIKKTANLNNYANEMAGKEARKEVDAAIEKYTLQELEKTVEETQLDLETKDADTLFKNSRALREKASALQAAAEHEKFLGTMVSLDVVEKIMFERARACRDGLMTSARRMSPLIVGKTDIKEVESLLMEEYKVLLNNFAKLPVVE